MKNILVPTDYSDTARTAYWYARELALYLESDLQVLRVYHPSFDATNPYSTPAPGYLEEAEKRALQAFIDDDGGPGAEGAVVTHKVKPELRLGFAAEEIVAYSKREEVDLIVMGTTGQGGFLEKVFGRISLQVSREAHCPVWLVPNGYQFDDLTDIVYASNYELADADILKQIATFADRFSAATHLVHVEEEGRRGPDPLNAPLLEEVFAPLDLEFSRETIQSERAWTGLKQYIEERSVDLLVIATKHRQLWDRLTHTSLTKKMLEGIRVPILVMPIL